MNLVVLENIIIFIIIFLGVWLIETYWFFVLLIFVNTSYRTNIRYINKKSEEEDDQLWINNLNLKQNQFY